MDNYQHTIKNCISLSGIGLHTGHKSTITFKPSKEDSGILFKRIDIAGSPVISALITNVVSTNRGTSIGKDNIKIHTVEHIMAALFVLGIDNILIEINCDEPPIMDGSAKPFCETLLDAKLEKQNKIKEYVTISNPISYVDKNNDIEIHILPSKINRITYILDYEFKGLSHQEFSIDFEKNKIMKDIIPARTFCLLSEVKDLLNSNLIKGGSIDNAVIYKDQDLSDDDRDYFLDRFKIKKEDFNHQTIIGDRELRYNNEPIRHKVLDLIGDLALLGKQIKGHIIASKSGHKSNIEFVRRLLQLNDSEEDLKVDSYSIDQIMEILPHRYPFLLIDKITSLNHGKDVVAIKNVTINEPFFEGHFPSEPIMPGVLLLESMAQAGGFLVLNSVENPKEKLMYFSGINNARFKKIVKPGDQLVINAKLLKMKLNTCMISCKITINNKIVCTAEFLSTIVDRGASN